MKPHENIDKMDCFASFSGKLADKYVKKFI